MPYDEDRLAELEIQDEARSKEVSIEEKKAMIKRLKREYGNDWTKVLKGFGGSGSGIDWQSLKFRMS